MDSRDVEVEEGRRGNDGGRRRIGWRKVLWKGRKLRGREREREGKRSEARRRVGCEGSEGGTARKGGWTGRLKGKVVRHEWRAEEWWEEALVEWGVGKDFDRRGEAKGGGSRASRGRDKEKRRYERTGGRG